MELQHGPFGKAHQLIKRFSEDVDFKLALSDAFIAKSQGRQRKTLSEFKQSVTTAWEKAGFTNFRIEAAVGNAYVQIEMDYPTVLGRHAALRPHILAELSARPPRLGPQDRTLGSFVAQFRGNAPEVVSILCVDPVETAADKLSALAWRLLVRDRESDADDPTIIRHVHDLAVLEPTISVDQNFGTLLCDTLIADSQRGGGAVAGIPPRERLAAMSVKLESDSVYADEYRRFVEGMAFAGAGEIPTFVAARQALRRLSALLRD